MGGDGEGQRAGVYAVTVISQEKNQNQIAHDRCDTGPEPSRRPLVEWTHPNAVDLVHLLHHRASIPLLPPPAVMPEINVPPVVIAEVKEAMASTSGEILRLRSAGRCV